MREGISLRNIIAPHFYELHRSIKKHEYSEYWLKGGRGSAKSSFVAIEIILGIIKYPDANAIVFRKVANTLRDSVRTTLLWAIDNLGVSQFFDSKVAPMEIIYKPTGQRIILKGLDEPSKVKSLKLRCGFFKYLWFEEASEFSGMDEIRSVEQSILRGGGKDANFIEFLTYNPPNDPRCWINVEVEKPALHKKVSYTNYLTMPREWLGETFFNKAEALKINDNELYRHEYLGEAVGNSQRIVFAGKYEVKEFSEPDVNDIFQRRLFFGADWGFANDPTCLIRCWIKDSCLYIDYEAFQTRCEIVDLPSLFDRVPLAKQYIIYADSARPETISYVKKNGYPFLQSVKKTTQDLTGEKKGTSKGYVEDGIEYIKGTFRKIYIHPRCKNIINEFQNYSFVVDNITNEILPKLEDKYNHGIDALRYALSTYIIKKAIMVA